MPTDITPKMVEESGLIIQEFRLKLQRNPEDAELKRMHETAMENHRALTNAQNQQLQQIHLHNMQNRMLR